MPHPFRKKKIKQYVPKNAWKILFVFSIHALIEYTVLCIISDVSRKYIKNIRCTLTVIKFLEYTAQLSNWDTLLRESPGQSERKW